MSAPSRKAKSAGGSPSARMRLAMHQSGDVHAAFRRRHTERARTFYGEGGRRLRGYALLDRYERKRDQGLGEGRRCDGWSAPFLKLVGAFLEIVYNSGRLSPSARGR